jgi:hypothetical protein
VPAIVDCRFEDVGHSPFSIFYFCIGVIATNERLSGRATPIKIAAERKVESRYQKMMKAIF